MAKANTMDVIFVDYVLPGEPEGTKPQRVTLKEFLALPPDQLTEQNQKVQKALGQLYKLNDREPPLFLSFPKREVGPLVIDCTPIEEENIAAHYLPGDNKVELVESELESTELRLINIFAHELKHAEQFSEELCYMNVDAHNNDGLAYHQLEYLVEAQAYAFDGYVSYLAQLNSKEIGLNLPLKQRLFFQPSYSYYKYYRYYQKELPIILKKHTKGRSIDDFSDIQCEMMEKILPLTYEDELYRDKYDERKLILMKDKGITGGNLPASFRFKDPNEAFSLLKNMPREAITLGGRSYQNYEKYHQSWEDHPEIYDAIDSYSTEDLKQLVEEGLESKELSLGELSFIVKEKFTSNGYNPEDAELTKDMLNFFLDLQVDGKPLMQEKDISDLLDGASASYREDVKKAILDYQKEHPKDKRFPKNKGLLYIAKEKSKRLRSQQLWADVIHREIKRGSSEALKTHIKCNLENKSLSSGNLLEIIAKEFTHSLEANTSDECIQRSEDMLDFFLDLQVNGKPLMQGKYISKLFKETDRDDVKEEILAYKAEHPDDKRFSENMFDLNIKDKVAEFVQRQERKAAEVEVAAKNAAKKAANKSVSALTAAVKTAKSK